jgi:hypothetical protein
MQRIGPDRLLNQLRGFVKHGNNETQVAEIETSEINVFKFVRQSETWFSKSELMEILSQAALNGENPLKKDRQ